MPRQPRLDAPDTLHHVMVRGIERTTIFPDDPDRRDFIGRLAALAETGAWTVYTWALLPNRVHLVVRTGTRPLARTMRSLLTGYAGAFNRRHHRVGHLFQNRYKSILVEEEPYLLELVRYVHLNPLRATVVPDLRILDRYSWTGLFGAPVERERLAPLARHPAHPCLARLPPPGPRCLPGFHRRRDSPGAPPRNVERRARPEPRGMAGGHGHAPDRRPRPSRCADLGNQGVRRGRPARGPRAGRQRAAGPGAPSRRWRPAWTSPSPCSAGGARARPAITARRSSPTSGSRCWTGAPATSPAPSGRLAGTSPPPPGVAPSKRPGGRPRSPGGVATEIRQIMLRPFPPVLHNRTCRDCC